MLVSWILCLNADNKEIQLTWFFSCGIWGVYGICQMLWNRFHHTLLSIAKLLKQLQGCFFLLIVVFLFACYFFQTFLHLHNICQLPLLLLKYFGKFEGSPRCRAKSKTKNNILMSEVLVLSLSYSVNFSEFSTSPSTHKKV